MTTTTYSSRIDAWLVVVLALSMGATAYVLATVPVPRSAVSWGLVGIGWLVGVGLPLWVLLGTRYTLASQVLSIRSGPFRWRIPVAEITHVAPTRSLLSSPALSLHRLRIQYGRRSAIMVSPRDPAQFLQALEALRGATGSATPVGGAFPPPPPPGQ